jgi:hypothetical protein
LWGKAGRDRVLSEKGGRQSVGKRREGGPRSGRKKKRLREETRRGRKGEGAGPPGTLLTMGLKFPKGRNQVAVENIQFGRELGGSRLHVEVFRWR